MHLLSHFSATLAQDRLSEYDQAAREKSLEIYTLPWPRELNTGHGEDRQGDSLIIPLSCDDPGHGEGRE